MRLHERQKVSISHPPESWFSCHLNLFSSIDEGVKNGINLQLYDKYVRQMVTRFILMTIFNIL